MKKKIIIVEDDPAILDALTIMLDEAGHEVAGFRNGEAILNNSFEVPQLFILDKQLSGVDGLDICRFLKDQERTRGIPVMMLSASPQVERQAMLAGADDFIEKPLRMQRFLSRVSKLLA